MAHAPSRHHGLDHLARAGARARRAARLPRRQLRERFADVARRRWAPHARMAAAPGRRLPSPSQVSPYDLWETVVSQLSLAGDPHALRLGDEVRPLTALWDGLECYAAHGDEPEPQQLATTAGSCSAGLPTGSDSSITTRSATRGSGQTAASRSSRSCSRSSTPNASRCPRSIAPRRIARLVVPRRNRSSPSIARNAMSSQRCAPANGCGSASRAKKPTADVSSG